MFNAETLTSNTVIRAHYTIDQVPSKRIRSRKANAILSEHGKKVHVYELAGELNFGTVEIVLSQLEQEIEQYETIILNLRRVTSIVAAGTQLIAKYIHTLHAKNKRLILSDTDMHPQFLNAIDTALSGLESGLRTQVFEDVDHATEWCENQYLAKFEFPSEIIRTSFLSQQEILTGLTSADLDFLKSIGNETNYNKGDYLCRAGDISSNLYFILSGYVSIMIKHDSGKQKRMATFDAGSVIGEFSVVDKRPRSADIMANTKVTCLIVDFTKIENDPGQRAQHIRSTIIENLARRMVEMLRKANTEIRALSD